MTGAPNAPRRDPLWRRYLRFWGPDVGADVDAELDFHLAMRARDYEAQGLGRAEAERAARAQFGDVARVRQDLVTHDEGRERRSRRRETMGRFAYDIRLALRGFRRTPAFTAAVVLILALGIGMASAMATVYDAVLRRPLPVRDQNALAVLWTYHDPAVELTPTLDQIRTFARESRTLRDVAGVAHWGANEMPLLDGDRSVVLHRAVVTGNFFDVLGARPVIGRLLRLEDETPGAPHAMVLSHTAWRSRFGGDTSVIGRSIIDLYSRDIYTVVGVAPPGLDYPIGVDYWMPVWPEGRTLEMFAVGRLAPGATRAAAGAELLSVAQRLAPQRNLVGATAVSFADAIVGDIRATLRVLTAAVALLLLIACVNIGGLLLVRAGTRARELAVRRALGARSGDIVRQLVVESALLGTAGGMLGLVGAKALLRTLVALAPAQLPRLDVIALDGAPLATALAVTLAAVLAFGVLPAFGGARAAPVSTLRYNARAGRSGRGARTVRRWLVGSQIALAVVMLAGAALLARSLARLEGIALGFTAEHLAIASVSWNATPERTPAERLVWAEQVVERVRALPSVVAVTPILVPPFLGTNVWRVQFEGEGQTSAERDAIPFVPVEMGGADYFRTFGIPLVRGRGFVDADRAGSPKVAVVSESVAERLWPVTNPIGKRLRIPPGSGAPDSDSDWRTVVGVVRDTRFRALREATPTVYLPWHQLDGWQGAFAVRATGDPATLGVAMRRAAREVNSQLDVWRFETVDGLLGRPLAQPRLTTLLLSGFSLVALLLAAVGLYGVMASTVRERTRELGVRSALGATPRRLRREVLVQAFAVTGAGALVGLAGALAASRLVTALLYETSPTDPVALLGACALLLAVALLAAYVPAHRATRIDPAVTLRAE